MSVRRSLLLVVPLTLAAFACSEMDSDPVGPSDAATTGASHRGPPISAPPAAASPRNFVAPLDSDQEVPPVDSRATGVARFQLSKDGSELSFRLNVANIQNVLMAHIHMAPRGANGPVVAWLYPSGPPPELIPGRFGGTLATGTITADDLVGPLEEAELDALVEAMNAGDTYVNVHTTANPPGEIRGQIEAAGVRVSDAAPMESYEITIENLTSGGQPFTPPLVVLHRGAEDLFTVDRPASFELKEIAENGNLDPMLMALEENRHVSSFGVGATPPVPPLEAGETVTLALDAEPGSEFISFVSMLICTNDGVTGVDRAHLPNRVGQEWVGYADAYDAGTELNTEDLADMVPPCQALTPAGSDDTGTGSSDPDLAENGVIHHHEGIEGDADLDPDVHDWENPVAKVTVRRTG